MEGALQADTTGAADPTPTAPRRPDPARAARRRGFVWCGLAVALVGSVLILWISHQWSAAGQRELVRQTAMEEGLDPLLAEAVVHAESRGNPRAVSRARAYGLMQLRLPTASEMAGRPVEAHELMEPRLNVQLGCRYLARLLRRYGGNLKLALMAYNAGPGNVDSWRAKIDDPDRILAELAFRETKGYVAKVYLYMRAHEAGG